MSLKVRFEIFKRDQFTCRYCGKKSPEAILELDHVIPLSKGGQDEFENLLTACFECNRGKGARLLTDNPPTIDLHDQTVLLAEHELQLQEFTYWRLKQREREDEQIDRLRSYWLELHEDGQYFSSHSVRVFIRKLGYVDTYEALEWAFSVSHYSNAKRDWLYFCKRCWNQIKGVPASQPQDADAIIKS